LFAKITIPLRNNLRDASWGEKDLGAHKRARRDIHKHVTKTETGDNLTCGM